MKDIMLRIVSLHSAADTAGSDRIEFVTEGRAHYMNGILFITYDEGEMSGLPQVKTTVKIASDGRVDMKRDGTDDDPGTLMKFRKGKRFEGLYDTPYGPLQMEILTNRIVDTINRTDLSGSLLIDYDIALKGLSEAHTELHLELFKTEKNSSGQLN